MAIILGKKVYHEDGTVSVTWSDVLVGDTGAPAVTGDMEERTTHVISAGAGTAQMAGSNVGTNFVNKGVALAANTITADAPNTRFTSIEAVATAAVTVILAGRQRGT